MAAELLVIDGPLQGTLVPSTSMPLVYTTDGDVIRSYWLHSWTLLGRVVNVLSIYADSTSIDLGDLWDLLISDDAKQASAW